jgi:hypothetical protein
MFIKEFQDGSIELLVEGRSINPVSVDTDARIGPGLSLRAGREECPVSGIRDEVVIGPCWQLFLDRRDTLIAATTKPASARAAAVS